MIYWDKVQQFIKKVCGVCYYNAGKTELICRCYNCERLYSKNKGHLYLKVNDEYPVFHCFKCETDGSIIKLIKEYGGKVGQFADGPIVIKHNKKRFNTRLTSKTKVINPELSESKYTLKSDYVKSRLGYTIDLNDIPGLVFSVKDFIKINKVELSDWHKRNLDLYDKQFVGFTTSGNNKLILRNCDQTSKLRYAKLSITGSPDYYGVQEHGIYDRINTIVLCEGIFDVLLSHKYEHIREKFSNKNVVAWAAVLGNNYYNTIDYVLDDYMLPRANIIILSDSNIKESRYQFLRRNPRVVDLEIYWNKFGSDFGEHPVELIKSHSLVRRRPYEQVDGHFYKNKKRTQYNKK